MIASDDLRIDHDQKPVRVLGMLDGNIHDQSDSARIKYGQLFSALADRCELVDVCDVDLYGLDRLQGVARAFRWPKRRWREAYRKNPWTFERRSRLARAAAARNRQRADVIFQHGALFSSEGGASGLPVVLYADFTYRLAQREDPWRTPQMPPAESERWNSLEQQVFLSAAYVLTRSEYTRRSMIADYGVDPERVAAVGGGINFDRLPEAAPLPDVPRILFIGMNFERKGGEQLVAAFARARERVPEAELWMVTGKEDVAGPGIRRIPPTSDREEIKRLYRSASVFAMPSRCETWGDVFLEAMAYGLPCVGTTNDAMPEIIQHGQTGYCAAPDDVAGLADHLERLLRDAALRRGMGQQGRERVLTTYTWDHVVGRMLPYLARASAERLVGA